jgi:UDP-2-acetamido-2,6-beta-L-arabino-hexul-4-ose reductase
MSQSVTIEPLRSVSDQRGLVVEPMGADLLPRQRNVHLVLTEPGQVRGNHYHERGTEVTLVIGPALFRYREGAGVREVALTAGQAYRITIPPGIAHAFQNPGPALLVLIGFNTEAHDPARPDVVRDVLMEPRPAAIRPAAP